MWKTVVCVVVVWSCLVVGTSAPHRHIVLFKHPHFEGVPEKVLEYSKACKTFDEPIHVASVKVHEGCIILYSDLDCRGCSLKLPYDNPFIIFNTSSVRYC